VKTLKDAGHHVVEEDLYKGRFDAALSAAERQSYYSTQYDYSAVQNEVDKLVAAEAIVLFFPTWWFSFPAILKGWFDRAWGPGITFDHANKYSFLKPRLLQLRKMLAVTTLDSPWWVDQLVMRKPVKRVLKTGLFQACAPKCKFEMLSLYKCERLTAAQVQRFTDRITRVFNSWV
jgi:putative NADPH-quinone reductase